jgi:hypothetical protein
LPSTLKHSSTSSVQGVGAEAASNASMSLAAATVSCSTWRLPATLPHARVIACWAAPKEPRTASVAARRASP